MIPELRTLSELSLLPDSLGGWPFASILDHTKSQNGRSRLLRLIATPLATVESIRLRQRLLSALGERSSTIEWTVLLKQASAVAQYLSSNLDYAPRGALSRAIYGRRFPTIADEIATGLRNTSSLLKTLDTMRELLSSLPQDPTFTPIIEDLRFAEKAQHARLLHETVDRDRKKEILAFDALVRDSSAQLGQGAGTNSFRLCLDTALEAVWQLDAYCALATASASIEGTYPLVEDDRSACFEVRGLLHPLLKDGVPNDLSMSSAEHVAYLTGPNMAGKSTLLRSIGVAIHFAHIGMKVAATYARIPYYDRLLVSITARDNLARGESLFLAEIRRVGTIVDAVERGERVAAVLDEVFRGTNVVDATHATSLLLRALSKTEGCLFLVASHLAEAVTSIESPTGVAMFCMDATLHEGRPSFSYRLNPGVSTAHLGMLLLDAEGVGPALRRLAEP